MLRKAVLIASCAAPLAAFPANALTYAGSASGANASSVQLSVAGTTAANATVAPVSGSAPAAYDQTGGAASIYQNFTLTTGVTGTATQGLQTGIVFTEAKSGSASSMGTVTLNNVNEALASKLPVDLSLSTALGLTADTISSTTSAGMDGNGNLVGTGSSSLINLGLTGAALGALSVNGTLYANPAANTVLLSLAGLTVTLNEQLRAQTATSLSLQTNAVHIALSNYAMGGKLVSGDIVLGHSEASVTGAVPEAGTWATMLMGFGATGYAMRRKRGPGLVLI